MRAKRVFISADHGLAIVYFLQSDVVDELIGGGVEVVLLTDDAILDRIRERFGKPGLLIEGVTRCNGGWIFYGEPVLPIASIWRRWTVSCVRCKRKRIPADGGSFP